MPERTTIHDTDSASSIPADISHLPPPKSPLYGIIARFQDRADNIAIEIETGKSDVIPNVRRALRARVDRVLVVATSEKAMKKVEKSLRRGTAVDLATAE